MKQVKIVKIVDVELTVQYEISPMEVTIFSITPKSKKHDLKDLFSETARLLIKNDLIKNWEE